MDNKIKQFLTGQKVDLTNCNRQEVLIILKLAFGNDNIIGYIDESVASENEEVDECVQQTHKILLQQKQDYIDDTFP